MRVAWGWLEGGLWVACRWLVGGLRVAIPSQADGLQVACRWLRAALPGHSALCILPSPPNRTHLPPAADPAHIARLAAGGIRDRKAQHQASRYGRTRFGALADPRKRILLGLLHSFDAIPVHIHELVRGNRGFNLGPNAFQPGGEIATAHVAHAQMDDPGRRESPSCHTFERVLVAHQPGRVINTRQHLLATKRRKRLQHVVHGIPRRQHLQHGLDGDACSPQHRPPVAHLGINLDPV
jgi:hypothetical protein